MSLFTLPLRTMFLLPHSTQERLTLLPEACTKHSDYTSSTYNSPNRFYVLRTVVKHVNILHCVAPKYFCLLFAFWLTILFNEHHSVASFKAT